MVIKTVITILILRIIAHQHLIFRLHSNEIDERKHVGIFKPAIFVRFSGKCFVLFYVVRFVINENLSDHYVDILIYREDNMNDHEFSSPKIN